MARYKRRGIGGLFGRIILTILLIGVLCACFCGMAFAYYVHAYINPSVDLDVSTLGMDLNSFIYATNQETGEETLYETLKGEENRIWINSDQIPQSLKNAVVAIEDQRFYQHKGVDWKRTFGAALGWVTGSGSYGGSTITQQLIKNMTTEDDFSVKRKITEIFRALALEKQLDNKDRILELYLNTIYLGRNTYGVRTAAATYFGKELQNLTLAESAVLAGITNNPSKYDPYIYPENTKARQETILGQMLEQEMITQAEHDAAVAEPLNYRSVELYQEELSTPYSYFTDTVIRDVVDDLKSQKGYSERTAMQLVNSGGLKIYATIDLNIQQIMDEEYNDDSNFPDMERDGMRPESAMVITDKQGNIRGIVGGRGVKQGKLTGNYATLSTRQPGSSIKPLSAYGPAMDKGIITPESYVYDKALKEVDGKAWPRNDSGRTTNSPMLIRNALAYSVNTIAVQLVNMLTPQGSYDFLTQRLGFTTLVSSRTNGDGSVASDIDYGPLALGGLTDGVTVREMAGGYSSFINDGVFAGTRTYTKVLDQNGEVLLENTPRTDLGFQNVRTAYYMLDCMRGVTAFGTATGATISGVQTAGKTGTTSANYDRWFCGLTPEYSGACWFGFERNYTLTGVWGNPAADMWTKVMRRVHEGDSGLVFDSHPEDFETASYCMDSGLAPSGACWAAGRVATGRFWKGQVPTELCSHQGFTTYDLGANGIDDFSGDDEQDYDESWDDENTDQNANDESAYDPSAVDPETGEVIGGESGNDAENTDDTGETVDEGGGDEYVEPTPEPAPEPEYEEEPASDDPEARRRR